MGALFTDVSLFEACPLPGCQGVTERPGKPCEDCLTVFGDKLREVEHTGPAPTDDEIRAAIAERDAEVARIQLERARMLAGDRGTYERKRNQICWLCTARTTCTHTGSGWECDTCREIS